MKLSRRQTLGVLAGGAAAAAASGGCAAVYKAVAGPAAPLACPTPELAPDVAALSRFGFGPRADRPNEVAADGRDKWFEAQLAAPTDDPLDVTYKLSQMEIFHLTAYELRDLPQGEVIRQLQAAAIIRAVHSPWQLRERMVDFWTNHFNIFARKGLAAYRKPQDDRNVIRAHALGSFPDMLLASAKSTAMLLYLDQQASSFVQPNENYGRELLELHSLGVDAGYTQKDVMEAARCFTGWSEEREFLKARGQFRFRPDRHDAGPKEVLGHKIPAGGGVEDGETVVKIVANHPATSRHISRKLCRYFLGRDDEKVVAPVAAEYERTKGQIPDMLRAIYKLSEQGLTSPSVKRPFDFAVTAMRAVGAETSGGTGLQKHLTDMGQPLYQWPMPDGYPVDAMAWTGSLLARWNFVAALMKGEIRGASIDRDRFKGLSPEAICGAILGVPANTKAATFLANRIEADSDPVRLAAFCLASPEFQWRQ